MALVIDPQRVLDVKPRSQTAPGLSAVPVADPAEGVQQPDDRVFHLLLTIYFYEGNFEEVFRFAREIGIRPFQVVKRMQQMLPEAPEPPELPSHW